MEKQEPGILSGIFIKVVSISTQLSYVEAHYGESLSPCIKNEHSKAQRG